MRPRLVAFTALLTACSGSHGGADAGPAASAFASDECAPDDGRALRIVISDAIDACAADPSQPSIDFYLFSGTDSVFPIVAPATITSESGTTFGNGSATECPGGTPPCRTSQDWSITFDVFFGGFAPRLALRARTSPGDARNTTRVTPRRFAPAALSRMSSPLSPTRSTSRGRSGTVRFGAALYGASPTCG
jgi:hypothetical protein